MILTFDTYYYEDKAKIVCLAFRDLANHHKLALALVCIICCFSLNACGQTNTTFTMIHHEGKDISTHFKLPGGYARNNHDNSSFAWYLCHMPLKPFMSKVHYYDGREKPNQQMVAAVIDMEIGKRDLQQCADAVMRLRAEYLYAQKQYAKIHFNFTNGFCADYSKWADGNRISVKGNQVSWYASGSKDDSYAGFRRYMDIVFTYAGTLSLSREMKTVPCSDLEIGDVWIQGGSPGHAVIVIDVAIHPESGKKIFLIAQSYMPAQDIHILTNPGNSELSPWYEMPCNGILYTPEWTFYPKDLKRFE